MHIEQALAGVAEADRCKCPRGGGIAASLFGGFVSGGQEQAGSGGT